MKLLLNAVSAAAATSTTLQSFASEAVSQQQSLHLFRLWCLRMDVRTSSPSLRFLRTLAASCSRQVEALHEAKKTPVNPPAVNVVLIGRPNVGKSTLFNVIATGKKTKTRQTTAIVSARAGTTRDCKERVVLFGGLTLRLMDVGGLEDDRTTDASSLLKRMRSQVYRCLNKADIALFIIDAKEGILPLDELLAKTIRERVLSRNKTKPTTTAELSSSSPSVANQWQAGPAIVLVVNKADSCFIGDYLADCYSLNLGDPILISALKTQGLDDLYDRMVMEIEHQRKQTDDSDESVVAEKTNKDYTDSNRVEDTRCSEQRYQNAKMFSRKLREQEGELSERPDNHQQASDLTLCQDDRCRPPQITAATQTWLEGLDRIQGRCHGPSAILNQIVLSDNGPTDTSVTDVLSPDNKHHTPSGFLPYGALTDHTPSEEEEEDIGEEEECLPRRDVRADQYTVEGNSMVYPRISSRLRPSRIKTAELRHAAFGLKRKQVEGKTIRLVIIGKPNTGKSTLVNALLKEERQVVDQRPGSTTDAIAISWSWRKHPIELVDTAGVRRGWRRRGTDLVEETGKQTLRNIRASHVCILCIDARDIADGKLVGHHELNLASLVSEEEGKCLAIAVTKWDLVPEKQRENVRADILERTNQKMAHAKGCPVVFLSAVYGLNLSSLMTRIMALYRRWNKRIETSRLNSWIQDFMIHWPPPWKDGQKCDILFMCQPRVRPPTLILWSSTIQKIPANYLRQITNSYREEFGMYGTPVKLITRTTCMPKPGKKLTKAEILKWKRLGPKQAAAVMNRSKRGGPLLPNMTRPSAVLKRKTDTLRHDLQSRRDIEEEEEERRRLDKPPRRDIAWAKS